MILGAVQKLPAKQHSQSSQFSPKVGWIGCAIQQATSKRLPGFFFRFNILIFIYIFEYKTIETHARAFLPLIISAVGSVREETFNEEKVVALMEKLIPFSSFIFEVSPYQNNNLEIFAPQTCPKILNQYRAYGLTLFIVSLPELFSNFVAAAEANMAEPSKTDSGSWGFMTFRLRTSDMVWL